MEFEFDKFIEDIKLREEMMIEHGLDYQDCESDSRTNYTGRFNG